MAYIGKVPAVAALTASDITDGIISNAKLAQDIISADTALGVAPADTDEFLVSDAGVLKRMDYSLIKGGGKIGQVVQGTFTGTTTVSSSFADTGITAAITPAATSSKVLVIAQITGTSVNSGAAAISTYLRLLRGASAISQGASASSRTLVTTEIGSSGSTDNQNNSVITFLDSPSTTSETTYKIQGADRDLGGGTFYVNRSQSDSDATTRSRGTSNIILMEVLA